jgi:quercetin dioxygenase-like cupin family protein
MIVHHFNGGLYTKEMRVKAGDLVMKHTHDYDHQSILGSGEAIVCVDGVAHKYIGPQVLTIKANVEHEVYAVTDIVWFCQHITDCTDPEMVDAVLIKEA